MAVSVGDYVEVDVATAGGARKTVVGLVEELVAGPPLAAHVNLGDDVTVDGSGGNRLVWYEVGSLRKFAGVKGGAGATATVARSAPRPRAVAAATPSDDPGSPIPAPPGPSVFPHATSIPDPDEPASPDAGSGAASWEENEFGGLPPASMIDASVAAVVSPFAGLFGWRSPAMSVMFVFAVALLVPTVRLAATDFCHRHVAPPLSELLGREGSGAGVCDDGIRDVSLPVLRLVAVLALMACARRKPYVEDLRCKLPEVPPRFTGQQRRVHLFALRHGRLTWLAGAAAAGLAFTRAVVARICPRVARQAAAAVADASAAAAATAGAAAKAAAEAAAQAAADAAAAARAAATAAAEVASKAAAKAAARAAQGTASKAGDAAKAKQAAAHAAEAAATAAEAKAAEAAAAAAALPKVAAPAAVTVATDGAATTTLGEYCAAVAAWLPETAMPAHDMVLVAVAVVCLLGLLGFGRR